MIYLSRSANTVGLREVKLETAEDRQAFVGGPITHHRILGDIDVWHCQSIHANPSPDNVNLILRYGDMEEAGMEIDEYVFDNCFFATMNEEGNPIPLFQEQIRKLLAAKIEAELLENEHRIWVISLHMKEQFAGSFEN